jgi:hypothetical protein
MLLSLAASIAIQFSVDAAAIETEYGGPAHIAALQATPTRTPGPSQTTATPTRPASAQVELQVINAPVSDRAVVGETVSYYVGAWNQSAVDIDAVRIAFTLGTGLSLIDANVGEPPQWHCQPNGERFICQTIRPLAANQSSGIEITARVYEDAGNQVTNRVEILDPPDEDPGDNALTRTLTVLRPAIIAIPTATQTPDPALPIVGIVIIPQPAEPSSTLPKISREATEIEVFNPRTWRIGICHVEPDVVYALLRDGALVDESGGVDSIGQPLSAKPAGEDPTFEADRAECANDAGLPRAFLQLLDTLPSCGTHTTTYVVEARLPQQALSSEPETLTLEGPPCLEFRCDSAADCLPGWRCGPDNTCVLREPGEYAGSDFVCPYDDAAGDNPVPTIVVQPDAPTYDEPGLGSHS